MGEGRYTEEEWIALLENNREEGAAALWEAYSGLVWRVCARRLSDPEDIKESVNDTFAAFCLNPQKFDPAKGTLKKYLCAIADHQALDLCRKNERRQRAEEKAREQWIREKEQTWELLPEEELDEILCRLEPLDGAILRMKYYEGMSFKEIAARMELPYEAVKKRSQRSMKKLLKLLLLGLLLAALAGCAALLFQRFQFQEKTGFNWEEENPVYSLSGERPVCEKDGVIFTVTDAVYREGELYLAIFASFPAGTGEERRRFAEIADYYMGFCQGEGLSMVPELGTSHRSFEEGERMSAWFYWQPEEDSGELSLLLRLDPTGEDGRIRETTLYYRADGEEETFGMKGEAPVFELKLTRLDFSEDISSLGQTAEYPGGSLLIRPGHTVGEGAGISLYSISEREGYAVSPFLTQSSRGTGSGEHRPPYLTDASGKEYPAQAVSDSTSKLAEKALYIPGAGAGIYTLVIPQLCLEGEAETESVSLSLPSEEGEVQRVDGEVSFPDGDRVRILNVKAEKGAERIEWSREGEIWTEERNYWRYILDCESISGKKSGEEPVLCSFNASAEFRGGSERASISVLSGNQIILTYQGEEPQTEAVIKFHSPVYLLEQEIREEVEIKP